MGEKQSRLAAQHFAELPGPRVERAKQHPPVKVIVIASCAILADAKSFYDIEAFGHMKQEWLANRRRELAIRTQHGDFLEVDQHAFETNERGHGREEQRRCEPGSIGRCEALSELSYLVELLGGTRLAGLEKRR